MMDRQPSAMDPERSFDPLGGEYGVVALPDAWHVLSLACFLAALGARFLAALLPRGFSHGWPPGWGGFLYRPLLTALLVPAFAGLGLLFGLLGLRRPESRSAARLALGLNGIVLALSALALLAYFAILPH
jgi:hypothetical protein